MYEVLRDFPLQLASHLNDVNDFIYRAEIYPKPKLFMTPKHFGTPNYTWVIFPFRNNR